jgi:hypothetical protein
MGKVDADMTFIPLRSFGVGGRAGVGQNPVTLGGPPKRIFRYGWTLKGNKIPPLLFNA